MWKSKDETTEVAEQRHTRKKMLHRNVLEELKDRKYIERKALMKRLVDESKDIRGDIW